MTGIQRYEDLGHGLSPTRPRYPYSPVDYEWPDRRPASGAFLQYLPLRIARWRWSGDPLIFDLLDQDADGSVDEHELRWGLGRGMDLLSGEAAGPLDAAEWEGSPDVFRRVDADGDGRVSAREIARALGPHGVRLAHGVPAHGPDLPSGARYGWGAHARWVVFPGREAKADYMRKAAIHDAEDPEVQSWAREFRRLPLEERAAAILKFVQEDVRYERDPATFDPDGTRHGIELLDSAAVGLYRGYGDCDLKARLFVALCLASGVPARIVPVFKGETGFPHVRAEVLRLGTETAGEVWDVADPTIVNSTIGVLPAHPLTSWPALAAAA